MALTGCTAKKTEAPELTGPSELGLSLELRATPDVVTMDGQSQSQLVDHRSRLRTAARRRTRASASRSPPAARSSTYGRLSTKNVTTGSDGRATVTYTAPTGAPSQNSDGHTVITLIATPAGYDYRNALARQVDIRLVPQGVILPIAYAPVPKFTYSPTTPGEEADVVFDASSSIASCVPNPSAPNDTSQCQPQAGDDRGLPVGLRQRPDTASGVRPTTRFSTRGTYVVKLTVDQRSRSEQLGDATPSTVGAVANPTADFAVSPTRPRLSTRTCSSTPRRRRPRLAGASRATTGRSATAARAAASTSRTATRGRGRSR